MGRGNNSKRAAASSASTATTAWGAADHAVRQRSKTAFQERRRAVLSHETKEKRNDLKLKLHITRVKRELETLKTRLESWDPVEEKKRQEEEEERQRKEAEAAAHPPQKSPVGKGPATVQQKLGE